MKKLDAGTRLICLLVLLILAPSFAEIAAAGSNPIASLRSVPLFASDIVLTALFATWAVEFVRRGSSVVSPGHPWITAPVLLLLALSAVSASWALSRASAAYATLRLLVMVLLYLYLASHKIDHGAVAMAFVVALTVHSLVAVVQLGLQRPIGLSFLGEVAKAEPSPDAWMRGYGLGPHPNVLGGFLFVALTATAALAAHNTRSLLVVAVLALGTAGLLSTFSRSAWLATLALGLPALVAMLTKATSRLQRRYAYGVVVVLAAVLALFAVFNGDRLATRLWLPAMSLLGGGQGGSSLEQQVIDTRLGAQNAALEIIARRPLAGVGAGNFVLGAQTELGPSFDAYVPVHNMVLLLAAELGLLGGMLWATLTVGPLAIAWARRRQALSVWGLTWTAAWCGCAVISLFDFYFWGWQQGRILFWLLLGLWTNAVMRASTGSAAPVARPAPP
ncbi:MAG TPA: O-antigen ligase family protein [Thermoleophilia bacterium]|nr:O-antigen ligase family protein [Thermoleophilia bacterium]